MQGLLEVKDSLLPLKHAVVATACRLLQYVGGCCRLGEWDACSTIPIPVLAAKALQTTTMRKQRSRPRRQACSCSTRIATACHSDGGRREGSCSPGLTRKAICLNYGSFHIITVFISTEGVNQLGFMALRLFKPMRCECSNGPWQRQLPGVEQLPRASYPYVQYMYVRTVRGTWYLSIRTGMNSTDANISVYHVPISLLQPQPKNKVPWRVEQIPLAVSTATVGWRENAPLAL